MAETVTTFTSWRGLVEQLKADLFNPSFRKMQSYTLSAGGGGSRTLSYRSLSDLMSLIKFAEDEMIKEEGLPYHRRTLAANGGGGADVSKIA